MNESRTRRGPADPERPSRIIDAALSLMLAGGVYSLSHRAVGVKAGVPLGSTTYYFKDLDALLIASIERLTEQTQIQFQEWQSQVSIEAPLAPQLAELIYLRLTQQRNQATLAYELYTLAMRRPDLRPLSDRWKQVLSNAIGQYVEKPTAERVAALIDGIMIQGLISPQPPTLVEITGKLQPLLCPPSK
ncbi:TetR family transcriptional regulator [Aeromonas veronii]|uniref:TetR/AcrR family transcriptional regulator n=1 Tax=Aeromonas veronii TaxID=654 RepID=UPI00226CBA18|nr:TetR family transcriptional regulator C-terminal domain-containing protein [Aeromonas veronii]MCX9114729.1 TetR family transcriptional regulator [Aeromonas veronii]